MHFPHFMKRGLVQFCQFLNAKVRAWTKPCSPLLGAASDLTRSKQELILENQLLRQQSRVVDQQVKRPKLTWGDRARRVQKLYLPTNTAFLAFITCNVSHHPKSFKSYQDCSSARDEYDVPDEVI